MNPTRPTATNPAVPEADAPAGRPTRPSVRRRLAAVGLVAFAGVVPVTAMATLTASPASAKSVKCGVVKYDPVTHTSTVVCSRNRP